MADNVAITAGSGTTVAADDIGAGVLAQRVKPVWGVDGTGTDVTATTPLPVVPQTEVAGVGVGAAADAAATGNGSVIGLLKQLRVLLSGGLPAALGQTTMANSVAVAIASNQSALAVTDNSSSLTVDAPVGTPVFVATTPSTTGGWSVSSQTALTNTKIAVKASAGTFGGYQIWNPNTAVVHIQVFDVASAGVTLGSTTPTYVLSIPPQAAGPWEVSNGINHATAITLAATTTPTGSTAPASNCVATFLFK